MQSYEEEKETKFSQIELATFEKYEYKDFEDFDMNIEFSQQVPSIKTNNPFNALSGLDLE